jgi:hypothetical protein
MVGVYPTCVTRERHLVHLLRLTDVFHNRLEIRLIVLESVLDRCSNLLVFSGQPGGETIVTGAISSPMADAMPSGIVNLALQPDSTLLDVVVTRLDSLWRDAVPLTASSARIPSLRLPQGSSEGALLWQEYAQSCAESKSAVTKAEEMPEQALGEMKTPDSIVNQKAIAPSEPPSVRLGFPQPDVLRQSIARIYRQGCLVSIDGQSRLPPLDAPLRPDLFGDRATLETGAVRRKVAMRVSVIDKNTLRELEKCRQGMRSLLDKLSFGLSDGMRWIPEAAIPVLEAEVARINAQGHELVSSLLSGNVDAFLDGKMESLTSDMNAMYKDLGGKGTLSSGVIEQARQNLKERLQKAQGAKFVPWLSHSRVAIAIEDSDWSSMWPQACTLLYNIACYPRRMMSDSRFISGLGPDIDLEALLKAMDVADDAIQRDVMPFGLIPRCKSELDLLKRIYDSSAEARDKCDLIWRLMHDGTDPQHIEQELDAATHHRAQEGPDSIEAIARPRPTVQGGEV